MSDEQAKTKVVLFRPAGAGPNEYERLPGEFYPGDADYQCSKLRSEGATDAFVAALFEWNEHGLKIEDYYFKQQF